MLDMSHRAKLIPKELETAVVLAGSVVHDCGFFAGCIDNEPADYNCFWLKNGSAGRR
jgi:hypothetical protein